MSIPVRVLIVFYLFFALTLQAQFTPGNLALFRADNAAANNTGFSIIEINPSAAAQASPVNTYTINSTTGTNALRTSGSASSTGYVSTSNDGSLLCFTGHNSITTSGNANTILARGVGTLDAGGNYSLAATYTATSGNQTRCATSTNNTSWFIADQGGVYTNSSSAASPAGNFRSIKAFGGIVYIFQASASAAAVSSISAVAGGTVTALPGVAANNNAQDFYLIASGSNGSSFDVLYVLSATTATAGVIAKYSLVAGTWVANGTYTTSFGGFGLAAAKSGSKEILYATTGLGANAANSVIKLTDDGGYNTSINITTAANTVLYTTTATTTLKGISFAPSAATVAPSLSATPASFDFGNIAQGASSTGQSFTLTAGNLNPAAGSLTVTSPNPDFELFDGTSWLSTINLNYSYGGATIANLQARFSPHSAGASSANLSLAGGGLAAPLVISVNGAGTNNLSFDFSPSTTPLLNPPYVSGTVNDPADPAAAYGMIVTVKESGTAIPAANYTIAVSSNNNTVLPAANVNVVKSDGSAVVRLSPVATGYADITLLLAKGADTRTLVIHYAASTAASPAASWLTGMADASAAIALDNNYMIVCNDENNLLYVYNRNASGLPLKTFDFNAGNVLNLTDGTTDNWKELDLEAGAPSPSIAGKSYWLGSMSNSSSFNNKPNRDRLIGINTTGAGAAATLSNAGYYAGLRQQLINWGVPYGYNLAASAADGKDSKTIDGFNIEGMVFAPDNTTMYLGFRAPLVPVANRTKALIAPIQNFEAWFNSSTPGNAVIGAPIELNLGGRGIRDIIRLSAGNYTIVAGSYDGTSNPALYRWSGNPSDAPVQLTTFDLTGLNAEAAIGITESGQLSANKVQIICDNGDYVYYGDGIAAKDLAQNNDKKFLSETIQSVAESLLPVHFEYVSAQRNGNDVGLSWKTGYQDNAGSFDIMRSDNGINFIKIGSVPALANQTNYTFTDFAAPVTKLYYRLNATDITGRSYLSTIRTIAATGTAVQTVQLYPNPVNNGTFSLIVNRPGTKMVSIYNAAGMLFKQFSFGNTSTDVSTQGWSAGYYMVRIVTNDSNSVVEKLVIQ